MQTEAQRIAQRKYYEKNKLLINQKHRDYYYNKKKLKQQFKISHDLKTIYFS